MLSTVFATTPDCLALSEFASGRFLMVNQAFFDLFGYSREKLIGRTSIGSASGTRWTIARACWRRCANTARCRLCA